MFENLRLLRQATRQVFKDRFHEAVRREYQRLKGLGENPKLQIVYLQRLVRLEDNNPEFRLRLAKILAEQGDLKGAQHYRREALKVLVRTDQVGEAFRIATKAIEVDASDAELLEAYVSTAERANSLIEADAVIGGMLAADPASQPLKMALAWIREKRGEINDAYRLYRELDTVGTEDERVAEGLERTGVSLGVVSDFEQEVDLAMDALFVESK